MIDVQKEAEYAEARLRILGRAAPSPTQDQPADVRWVALVPSIRLKTFPCRIVRKPFSSLTSCM